MKQDQTIAESALPLLMRQMTQSFGSRVAVDRLDLEVREGEIVALLGPNGAGKSTTLSVALGFAKPQSGTVSVAGFDALREPKQARARTGYIAENVQLYPSLSGLENLEYFSALAELSLSSAEMQTALLDAGLQASAHHRPAHEYSKGMRQKTGIAIAMVRQCRLLLLDEPTSGLDPLASDEFNRVLQRTAGHGVGVLMATHDIARAKEVATRVIMMRHGAIAAVFERGEFAASDLERTYLDVMREA